ncbi:MAG: hypothetical protein RQ753_00915 [Desulfurivibrionaceae bacterium]|nr:hypothetical protein [Desulfobulbales bacterium]MDT8334237.1 hypothetical protein [Desulfurivibrionaceae bacterium]
MRPSHILALVVFLLLGFDAALYFHIRLERLPRQRSAAYINDIVTAGLGLTDLCLATEARYTRHPAVSDPMAPFMDHPGAIEHFPTGSFWAVPRDHSL